MSQMKEKENPRKTTKWSWVKQSSRKRIQNNDSEKDSRSQKKDRDKSWEHVRNFNKDLEELKNKDEQYNNWNEKHTRRN